MPRAARRSGGRRVVHFPVGLTAATTHAARRAVAGSTMVKKKPRTWGWKVIKYRYAKDMKNPADIALHMRGKGMHVGRT